MDEIAQRFPQDYSGYDFEVVGARRKEECRREKLQVLPRGIRFRRVYIPDIKRCCFSVSSGKLTKARCYRSQRKNEEPHYLVIQFESGDQGVVAKHIVHVKGEVVDIATIQTCTSRPQTWHIPRASSISPMPVCSSRNGQRWGEEKRSSQMQII